METTQTEIKSLKEGRYCIIDDEPCMVLSVSISKPGKHGSSKARVETEGLFDKKKRVIMGPGDDTIKVPVIEKRTAQVIAMVGSDSVQLMDMTTYETFEAKMPEDLKGKIQQGNEVLYWKFGHRMMLKSTREGSE